MSRFSNILTLCRSIAAGEFKFILFSYLLRAKKTDLEKEDLEQLNLSIETAYWYSNSGTSDLLRVFRKLNIVRSDSIIDFGSGKGGALLIFTLFPFKKISGVEISEKLIEIAKNNFKKLNVSGITTFHANASVFRDLDDYNYFYFFNPFPPNIMDDVLKNIVQSIKCTPRKVRIVYKLAACHDSIIANGFTLIKKFKTSGNPVCVYEN